VVLSIGVHPECVKERYVAVKSENLTNNLEMVRDRM